MRISGRFRFQLENIVSCAVVVVVVVFVAAVGRVVVRDFHTATVTWPLVKCKAGGSILLHAY